MGKLIDLLGKSFGKWTVIKREKNDEKSQSQWLCKCSCEEGTIKVVHGSSLRAGTSNSCGCISGSREFKDLTNMKFSMLTVISRLENNKHGSSEWLCLCDCTEETIATAGNLLSGQKVSCGCLRNDKKVRGGLSESRIYNIYRSMKARCHDLNHKNYEDYGERGILVCDEWRDDISGFLKFYDWATINGYTEDLTIDRINVNGNYEPNNCRWATNLEQQNNKRNSFFITINNITKTASEWGRENGINGTLINLRYRSGWKDEDLFKPVAPKLNKQSGIKGITWDTNTDKWILRITTNGKRKQIGRYETIEEAVFENKKYIELNCI